MSTIINLRSKTPLVNGVVRSFSNTTCYKVPDYIEGLKQELGLINKIFEQGSDNDGLFTIPEDAFGQLTETLDAFEIAKMIINYSTIADKNTALECVDRLKGIDALKNVVDHHHFSFLGPLSPVGLAMHALSQGNFSIEKLDRWLQISFSEIDQMKCFYATMGIKPHGDETFQSYIDNFKQHAGPFGVICININEMSILDFNVSIGRSRYIQVGVEQSDRTQGEQSDSTLEAVEILNTNNMEISQVSQSSFKILVNEGDDLATVIQKLECYQVADRGAVLSYMLTDEGRNKYESARVTNQNGANEACDLPEQNEGSLSQITGLNSKQAQILGDLIKIGVIREKSGTTQTVESKQSSVDSTQDGISVGGKSNNDQTVDSVPAAPSIQQPAGMLIQESGDDRNFTPKKLQQLKYKDFNEG